MDPIRHPPRIARTRITAFRLEDWPLAKPFVISRGAKTSARVLVVEAGDGEHRGRGEAVPYARFGDTPEGAIEALQRADPDRPLDTLLGLPAGAARNALDCALWDLAAKSARRSVADLMAIAAPARAQTCFTISLGSPGDMAREARAAASLGLLKLKLGGDGDDERMRAVRAARPDARLVADANEAWQPAQLDAYLAVAAELGFELVEQPLPADDDDALASVPHRVPVCADESVRVTADLDALRGRYEAVNIKLDKAGGLTEASNLSAAARARGLKIMVGSMVATSLAVAPALLLAGTADWVDLDGPLLLAADRDGGLEIHDGWIGPPSPSLWG